MNDQQGDAPTEQKTRLIFRSYVVIFFGLVILLLVMSFSSRYFEHESQRRVDCFLALRKDCESSIVWVFSHLPPLRGEDGVELLTKFNKGFPVTDNDLTKHETVSTNESGAPMILSASVSNTRYDNGIYYFKIGKPIEIRVVAYPADDSQISWSNNTYTSRDSQALVKEGKQGWEESKFDRVALFKGQWLPNRDTGSLTISVGREDGKQSWFTVTVKSEN